MLAGNIFHFLSFDLFLFLQGFLFELLSNDFLLPFFPDFFNSDLNLLFYFFSLNQFLMNDLFIFSLLFYHLGLNDERYTFLAIFA